MSKPEWGIKRTCNGCSAKFYDLKKDPIICPKCGEQFDPNAQKKKKRGRVSAAEKAKIEVADKKIKKQPEEDIDDDFDVSVDDEVIMEDDEDFEDEVVITKSSEDDD